MALVSEEGEAIELDGDVSDTLLLLKRLDGSSTEEELSAHPAHTFLFPLLRERGWLVSLHEPISALLADYSDLSREVSAFAQLFPERLDTHIEAIASKSVLLIGCGGIGTNVAFALCAVGLRELVLVDPDIVEISNLNRQFLFTSNDVGMAKVQVLARELGKRFPRTIIDWHQADFDQPAIACSLIADADLVVLCGESKILYDQPDLVLETPLILSGYRGAIGTIGPLVDPAAGSACWSCMMDAHRRQDKRKLSEFAVEREHAWNPSGFSVNSLTGSICSRICIEVLSDQPTAQRWLGTQLSVSMSTLIVDSTRLEPIHCAHSQIPLKASNA